MHAHTHKLFKLSRSSGSGVTMEMEAGWAFGPWRRLVVAELCARFLVLLQSYTKHVAAHPKSIQRKDFEESTQFRGTRVNLIVVQEAGQVGHALSQASINGFFHKWASAR